MSLSVSSPVKRQLPAMAMLLVSALALAACQSKTAELDPLDPMTTASTGSASLKATSAAAENWQKDPGNSAKTMAYVAQLEGIGQTDRKLEVLQRATSANPKDQQLQSFYGKALAESGRLTEATNVLESSVQAENADWKTFSALGSTYDQQARHKEARVQYQRALDLAPGEASILNNLGMSFALEGNLKKAEETLRQAVALPAAQKLPRVRQNLALVVGLQGRFEDAREIASKDLPPAEVEANMAFLQTMLAQPNTWQQLKAGG